MSEENKKVFMGKAIDLAMENVKAGKGGPFGAVVVKDGKIIASGTNLVTSTNDPTAHAEVTAIRNACRELGSFQLEGCELYTSCEPCPMCLGAIYWARPDRFYYAATQKEASNAGFDDSFIYKEIPLPIDSRSLPAFQLLGERAMDPFNPWNNLESKTEY